MLNATHSRVARVASRSSRMFKDVQGADLVPKNWLCNCSAGTSWVSMTHGDISTISFGMSIGLVGTNGEFHEFCTAKVFLEKLSQPSRLLSMLPMKPSDCKNPALEIDSKVPRDERGNSNMF